MKKHIFTLLIINLISYSLTQAAIVSHTPLQKDTTVKTEGDAVIFIPGIVPSTANQVAAPAFSPDGKSVIFGQSKDKKPITLVISYLKRGKWSEPVLAPFSGEYPNLEPAFSPDGKFLIFASSRPNVPGGSNIDGNWGKKSYAGKGGNLWRVDVTKKGWGTPRLLPDVINQNTSVFSPAVAADGSIYFMLPDTSGRFHIHRSQFKNGKYETAIRQSFCVDNFGDFDPAVAPDESFLIFSSGRAPALPHTSDLFIVFRTPSGWSEPIDIRTLTSDKVFGVEARLSLDLKTLYFSNQHNAQGVTVDTDQYIWQVDISKILKAHGL